MADRVIMADRNCFWPKCLFEQHFFSDDVVKADQIKVWTEKMPYRRRKQCWPEIFLAGLFFYRKRFVDHICFWPKCLCWLKCFLGRIFFDKFIFLTSTICWQFFFCCWLKRTMLRVKPPAGRGAANVWERNDQTPSGGARIWASSARKF